ncbi:MAG: LPS export ABC transporter periplasmic protein LptC [Rhodocyclaceae bacterium]|nr:LPS export ABC transporter periplasmic protein LptC [Rhodocyclaceae bacterium]
MNDRPALWFPLVLLAVLAALTTWLDFEVRSSMTEAANRNRHDPDTILHDFVTQQTGKGGAVETTVRARTFWRYMDDGSNEFEQPQVMHRDARGVLMDIRSDRGRASSDQQTLDFEGHVSLHQGGGKAPVSMQTSALRVLPRKNLAFTDQTVRFNSADTVVTGLGLDFDMNKQTLRIRSRVKVVYNPPRSHATKSPPSLPDPPDRRPAARRAG